MKSVAFLTLENPTGFVIYDSLCIPFFKEKNIEVYEVPWTHNYNWSEFDLVIIRSTWDYQKKWYKFIEVLKQIQQQTLLANPLEVVLWNYQKNYLQELKIHSFEIVDSFFGDFTLSQDDFENLQILWNSMYLVIKPQISANADDTFILKGYEDYRKVIPIFINQPFIIQPYVNNIENEGEISLFYFHSNYSHSVKKQPKKGDFRVQEEHGGIISFYEPTTELLEIANSVNDFLEKKFGSLLFARLDFVYHSNIWKIMELELIEPSLYFPYHPNACNQFVVSTIQWYEKSKKIF